LEFVGNCLPCTFEVCGINTALTTRAELIISCLYNISGLEGLKKYTKIKKIIQINGQMLWIDTITKENEIVLAKRKHKGTWY
jgi:hypothetical protein